MSQYVGACLRGISSIVVAHFLATIVIKSATGIAIVFIFFIEKVEDGQPGGYLFRERQLEGISQAEVVNEISIQCLVFLTSIIQILFTYILRLKRGFPSFPSVCQSIVHQEIGREGNGCIAMVYFPMGTTYILVFVQGFCKVLNTVTAPGGIDIPREAEVGTDTRHEFHTHPIAIGHISGQRFTNFIQFARQHQLILVIHIIKVGTEVQPTIGIGIAQFIVYEAFGFGVVEQLSIGVIVAGRFLVGYTERAEQPTIPIDLPRKPHFRIEEVEAFVNVQLLQALVRQTVPFVVGTLYPIVDVAILHIGIYIQLIS